MVIANRDRRYVRSLGADPFQAIDEATTAAAEAAADESWWLTAARIAGGDALVDTLSNAYSAATAATGTQVTAVKQTITDKLKQLAAQGIAEAKRLAAEAEARIRKAAEAQAYTGGLHGMLLIGGAGLLIWLLTRRR